MKQEKIYKKRGIGSSRTVSFARRLLIGIAEEMADWDFVMHHQSLTLSMGAREGRRYLEILEHERDAKYRKQEIVRLIKRRWITARAEGERMVYRLTQSGKITLLKSLILHETRALPVGHYCMVVFDVPEAARTARLELRRFLKKAQFKYCQASVWTAGKDVGSAMKELAELLEVERWVRVFTAIPA